MFSAKSIPYYDLLYAARGKDYEREVAYILKALAPYRLPARAAALDVACGTGKHLQFLRRRFRAEGLDISREFLRIARKQNPRTRFHLGDMRSFRLGRRFDLITCLFSSIGYMTTLKDLHAAIRNMRHHLADGGVLVVEPWLTPRQWHPGRLHCNVVDEADLKIVRMNTTAVKGRISSFELHYLVGRPEGVVHFSELHRARLSTVAEMTDAFHRCGLEVTYDANGPTGRGLFLGRSSRAGQGTT